MANINSRANAASAASVMRGLIILLVSIVVLLGLVGTTELGTREHPQNVASRSEPRSSGDVVARGRIEPRGGVIAVSGPPESLSTVAIVDKLLVGQGSKVVPGQLLAVIYGYDLSRADYEVALANLSVARLQRAQLQAGIGKTAEIAAQLNVLAARRAQLLKTQKDWSRATNLVQRNAASVQLLDTEQAALDEITQEVEQTQNTIKSLTEVRPVDDALAAGQVAVAAASVAKAKAAMERLQIRARQAGTVLSIQTHDGESITGDGILRLGDLDHLIVIAEVDDTQIQRVTLGMTASIEGPLFPEPAAATVTRIANEVYRQKRPSSDILIGRDARVVEVELTPQRPLPEVIGAEVTVRLTPAATASR